MFSLFLKGLIIGFSIAMPVGPIGMLCIRHSIMRGMSYGLVVGMGAALADALYGALAAFGVTALATFLDSHSVWFKVIGALFLLYLGLTTFLAKPSQYHEQELRVGYLRVFITTFLLTLTNPLTILSFAGVFAGLGVGAGDGSIFSALIVTSGVFLGSAAWWLMLSGGAALLKKGFSIRSSHLLNRVAGLTIFAFGVLTVLDLMK